MFEFMVIVAAILVAQGITIVAMYAAVCSPRFAKWYAKKAMKVGKVVGEEVEKAFSENEL